ncbi:MAG: hypothetical protein GWO87_00640 [Xanthomonadaceae bacterium]|nr:hypothetical protein [Rhodospirillaceae bacterium]NIA17687.1 hypothetical protein [Xanthomonadaceae bacterium]
MKKIISLAFISIFLFSMMFSSVALAQGFGMDYVTTLGLGTEGLRSMISSVVNILLGFLGILAIIVVLVGGFQWMLSGGNEEKVASARGMIIAGVIGLAIVLASFAIVKFVVEAVA